MMTAHNDIPNLNGDRILTALAPMMDVTLLESSDDKKHWIVKSTVRFGFLTDDGKIFFFDHKLKDFKKIKRDLTLCPDNLLRTATEAYWAAANML